MPADPLKPLFSSLIDDPNASQTVDSFVVGLGERIDMLQDAEAADDLSQLAALTSGLVVDAVRAGFDPLAGIARDLERACLDAEGKKARQRLIDLTDLSQRIRLGHKGAV